MVLQNRPFGENSAKDSISAVKNSPKHIDNGKGKTVTVITVSATTTTNGGFDSKDIFIERGQRSVRCGLQETLQPKDYINTGTSHEMLSANQNDSRFTFDASNLIFTQLPKKD